MVDRLPSPQARINMEVKARAIRDLNGLKKTDKLFIFLLNSITGYGKIWMLFSYTLFYSRAGRLSWGKQSILTLC
jgi:hypothetical protein